MRRNGINFMDLNVVNHAVWRCVGGNLLLFGKLVKQKKINGLYIDFVIIGV